MDWAPSAPAQSGPAQSGPVQSGRPSPGAPERARTDSKISREQPSGGSTSADSSRPAGESSSDDPWSRAKEEAPGVWTVGAESNVGKSVEDPDRAGMPVVPEPQVPEYEPAAAQLPRPVRMPDEASTLQPDNSPVPAEIRQPVGALAGANSSPGAGWATSAQYVPATAADPSTAMAGPDVRNIASAAAPAAYASAPAQTAPAPASAPGSVKQSLYQRLSNSPEAEAGRAKAPARQAEAVKTYVQDTPSPDDETIEESSVFGRAAVERILGGKLVEERSLDGSPIAPRF